MSLIQKSLIVPAFLALSLYAYGQSTFLLHGGLDVDAYFNKKDSVLVVTYKNNMVFDQLVWIGDFSVAAILTESDISRDYLAAPMVHEIYLMGGKLKPKLSEGYFFRTDSAELNLYNYKILHPGHQLDVHLKINNDSLYRLIVKKRFLVKGMVTVVDFGNLEQLLKPSKEVKTWKEFTDLYYTTNLSGPVETVNRITLQDIPWKFNRTPAYTMVWGHKMGPENQGSFSSSTLIVPEEITTKNKLNFLPPEHLYRFASKQLFTSKIKLRNNYKTRSITTKSYPPL